MSKYDLCGRCTSFTLSDRATLKRLAREMLVNGVQPAGRIYDGALFLVEDNEALIISIPGKPDEMGFVLPWAE